MKTYKKKKKNVKKFRKNFNTRIIKSKQNYTVEDVSELLNVHPNTVGIWLKGGLPKIDNQQPYLIWGQDLIDFLNARNKTRKRPCLEDQLFCCKCQKPRRPQGSMVCIKIDSCRTNLIGICDVCGARINKTISPQKVDYFRNVFHVEAIHQENLIECTKTCATVKKK